MCLCSDSGGVDGTWHVEELWVRAVCLLDHIDERAVCNAIAPEKDVDGFHIMNIGRLCLDQPSIIPATAAAVWEIIKRTGKRLTCPGNLCIL